MRRREFIALVGSAATWPLAARAQRPGMQLIGFLHSASPEPYASQVNAFRQSLKETGYVEGQNVAIEYRWAENQIARLPTLAAELANRQVSVIVAGGSPVAALADVGAKFPKPTSAKYGPSGRSTCNNIWIAGRGASMAMSRTTLPCRQ